MSKTIVKAVSNVARVGVCMVVDDLGPNAGTERQVEETIRRLDPRHFDIHICCFADSSRLRELSPVASIMVLPLGRVYGLRGVYQMWKFRVYLRQKRIQVVHAWMVRSAIFAVISSLLLNCSVVTSRVNLGYWYTPLYIRVFQLLNRWTTRIFANSIGAKSVAIATEGILPGKIDVIYNGVDMKRYSPDRGDLDVSARLGIPEGACVVGIVANLRAVKDISLFLHASALVVRRIPTAAFLVVGQGPLRQELGQLAAQLGIGNHVFFSDGVGAVPDYLRRMCVGCLSSQSEGFSNAILEYMAAGLPVVATDVGGNSEAVIDGVNGYLVRERTPEAFARPIIQLLENEPVRRAMGTRGHERCRELFSIEVYMENMQRYYASIAGAEPEANQPGMA